MTKNLVRGIRSLGLLEENLELYHAAAERSDGAAKKDVLRALSVLVRADSPELVDIRNIKIDYYLLRRMTREAKSLLRNMTGLGDPQAKLEFTAEEHDEDRRFVQTILDEGRQSGDTLLRHACEWILAERIQLYVFTRTGDSLERAAESGEDTKIPHVPDNFLNRGHMLDRPDPVYEPDDLASRENIRYLAKEARGFAGTGLTGIRYIGIARPREAGRASVEETLRHEVQHVADRSEDVQAGHAKDSGRYLFESYATEYRAYSYEGPTFRHLSNDRRDLVRHSEEYGWTPRQWAIFEKIYKQYEHTKVGWDKNLPDALPDMSFRQAVLSYIDPDERGFNRLNSVRIDDFYNAMRGTSSCGSSETREGPGTSKGWSPGDGHRPTAPDRGRAGRTRVQAGSESTGLSPAAASSAPTKAGRAS